MLKKNRKKTAFGLFLPAALMVALLTLSGCAMSWVTGEYTPDAGEQAKGCDLETDLTSISIAVGDWESLRAYGYDGPATSISMRSENTSIATVEPTTGSAASVTGQSPGTTRIIVTDSYAGSGCSVSVSVEVH